MDYLSDIVDAASPGSTCFLTLVGIGVPIPVTLIYSGYQ
jgi:hypothetical protein